MVACCLPLPCDGCVMFSIVVWWWRDDYHCRVMVTWYLPLSYDGDVMIAIAVWWWRDDYHDGDVIFTIAVWWWHDVYHFRVMVTSCLTLPCDGDVLFTIAVWWSCCFPLPCAGAGYCGLLSLCPVCHAYYKLLAALPDTLLRIKCKLFNVSSPLRIQKSEAIEHFCRGGLLAPPLVCMQSSELLDQRVS